jgi:membrane-associated phospholipid phosphatase
MPYVSSMGEALFIIVVLFALMFNHRNRNLWYFIAATFSGVLPYVASQIIKSSAGAPRPLKFLNQASWIHILPEWPRLMERSFPSGHTTGAFSLFCFIALIFPHKNRWYGALFFLLALSVAYSRMYLAAHFFEDVYAGSILGAGFSLLVVTVMNKCSYYFFSKG